MAFNSLKDYIEYRYNISFKDHEKCYTSCCPKNKEGKDRFVIFKNQGIGSLGRFYCHHDCKDCFCGSSDKKSGDAIDFVVEFEHSCIDFLAAKTFWGLSGISETEASKAMRNHHLSVPPAQRTPEQQAALVTVNDKHEEIRAEIRTIIGNRNLSLQNEEPVKRIQPPSEQWLDWAFDFMRRKWTIWDKIKEKISNGHLLDAGERQALAALHWRGLMLKTAIPAGLAWNETPLYINRENAGLDIKDKRYTKFLVPRGIVMVSRRKLGGYLWPYSMIVRCIPSIYIDGEKSKIKQTPGGSAKTTFCLGSSKEIVFLTESILDAVLIWQASKKTVSVAGLISAHFKPDFDADQWIRSCKNIVIVPDMDITPENTAGAGIKAAKTWQALYPHALILPPVGGKDVHAADLAYRTGRNPGALPSRTWLSWALKTVGIDPAQTDDYWEDWHIEHEAIRRTCSK